MKTRKRACRAAPQLPLVMHHKTRHSATGRGRTRANSSSTTHARAHTLREKRAALPEPPLPLCRHSQAHTCTCLNSPTSYKA